MANRVVIQADIDNYGYLFVGSKRPMQLGDVIINTRTNVGGADGKGAFFCATSASTFAGARIGANIWIDGSALGTLYDFRLTNGSSNTEWVVSDEDNYAHIKPIPGTQVYVERNTTTNNGYTMLILDIKFCVLDGENDAYSGMRDGIADQVFLRGRFGIHLSGGTDLNAAHMLSVGIPYSTGSIGHFVVRGVEVEHGFSAVRFEGGNYEFIADFTCERCYLHDGISGEGFYLGATHGPPYTKLRFLTIRDIIIARRAAESIQVQHLIDEGTRSEITNFVIFAGDADWMNAFQPFQDSGIQVSIDDGNVRIGEGIIDSVRSIGYVQYGSPATLPRTTLNHTNPVLLQNCLFNDVSGIFTYTNVSTTQGVKWHYDNIYLRHFTNEYYDQTGETPQMYYIGQNNGTDTHSYSRITVDGLVKTSIFQSISSKYEIIEVTEDAGLADAQYEPDYVNSGAYEAASKWKGNWYAKWGDYFGNTNGTAIVYHAGDIVAGVVDGQQFFFYKCLVTHTSSTVDNSTRPKDNATLWMKLRWDALGVRNDQGSYNAALSQSWYPPDNYALKADSYWNIKGFGLTMNEPNTSDTQYQWQGADNATGLNARDIPTGGRSRFKVRECDKYVRCGVRIRGNNTWGPWKYSRWELVS